MRNTRRQTRRGRTRNVFRASPSQMRLALHPLPDLFRRKLSELALGNLPHDAMEVDTLGIRPHANEQENRLDPVISGVALPDTGVEVRIAFGHEETGEPIVPVPFGRSLGSLAVVPLGSRPDLQVGKDTDDQGHADVAVLVEGRIAGRHSVFPGLEIAVGL